MPSKKPISKPRQSIINKKRAKRITKRQLQELEDFLNYYQNLHKVSKKPKVKQNTSKIDFTNDLANLFNEPPVVKHKKHFKMLLVIL